jgi:MFS family permease
MRAPDSSDAANRNWRRFVLFRVLFNSRFYYPGLAVLFLGLSATQYTLLNFSWAVAIVCMGLPAGALADRIGRRPLVIAAAVAINRGIEAHIINDAKVNLETVLVRDMAVALIG